MIHPYPIPTGVLPLESGGSIDPNTGAMSLVGALRPRVDVFRAPNGLTYVEPIRKTAPGACEWSVRFHSADTNRPNHLAIYAFNPAGGFGAGARWGLPLPIGQWTTFAACWDRVYNEIALWVDGVRATSGERCFMYQGTPINPVAGPAPVTIGNGFQGDVGPLTFMSHALGDFDAEILCRGRI